MSSENGKIDERTKDLMRALLRQPPKLHEEMKLKKSVQGVHKKERPASKGRVHKGKSGN